MKPKRMIEQEPAEQLAQLMTAALFSAETEKLEETPWDEDADIERELGL